MRFDIKTLIAAGLVALLSTTGVAQAQSQGGGSVSDAELQEYTDATHQVQEIRQEYSGQLEGIQDQEKARKLQQKANQEMVSAVQDTGMSVEEYNQLSQKIRENPELAQRVQQMLE